MDFKAVYQMIVDFFTGAGGWTLAAILAISAIGIAIAFLFGDREREAEENAVLELLRH